MSGLTTLCLCGCQQPRQGDSRFAVGCYQRLGNEGRRLLRRVKAEETFQANSIGLVYRCAEHPGWSTAERAERERHFRIEHPPPPLLSR